MLHANDVEEAAMTGLTDRVVLVTGAAGGIGQALCRAFAAAGMRVGICDVNSAGAERLAHELGSDRAIAVEGDVADPASCERAVAAVVSGFGALHALVNNAGLGMGLIRQDHMTKPVTLEEVSIEVWHRFMATNLSGAFHMAKAAMPHYRAAGTGRIINVTTSFFTMLRQGFYPYGVAKAGLEAWTASLSSELGGSGITVNVVVPGGPTDTPMVPPAGWPDLARNPVWPGGRPGR
jgi:NAD(P)-dependent dehydrogenase (short-subunit alcohol dehydrogenase family)